jgi:hypothetical protein
MKRKGDLKRSIVVVIVAVVLAAAGLILASDQASAQNAWIPVVAKKRTVFTHTRADGSKSGSHEEFTFERSSSGKVREERRRVENGVWQPVESVEITDYVNGKIYQIQVLRRRVRVRSIKPRSPTVAPEDLEKAKAAAVGEQVINGLRCYGFPMMVAFPGLAGLQRAGTGWRSLQYDLHVRFESEFTKPDGGTVSEITEMYDIEIGAEPPAEHFELPEGFEVVEELSRSPNWNRP